jgi:hypothetical protein
MGYSAEWPPIGSPRASGFLQYVTLLAVDRRQSCIRALRCLLEIKTACEVLYYDLEAAFPSSSPFHIGERFHVRIRTSLGKGAATEGGGEVTVVLVPRMVESKWGFFDDGFEMVI